MRASELLGIPVLDSRGAVLGHVTDLRCVQNGPLTGVMCAPRIEWLLVSRRRLGAVLGYDRREQQGPWVVRAIVRILRRPLLVVPWSAVQSYEGKIILKP